MDGPRNPNLVGAGVFLSALVIGLVVFIFTELRRWRALGGFLSRRQIVVRVVNLCLIALLVALIGGVFFGVRPATLRLGVALLVCAGVVLVIVVLLAVWDLREINRARLGREMEFYGEIARSIVGAKKTGKGKGKGEGD